MSSIVWMVGIIIIGSVMSYSEVGSVREVCLTYQECIYGIKMYVAECHWRGKHCLIPRCCVARVVEASP